MALLDDLGKTGRFIDHHKEFFRKQWPESLFHVIWCQDHVITEIFVNKIIGDNIFMPIDLTENSAEKRGEN